MQGHYKQSGVGMKPSSRDFLRYDAQTYAERGFIEVSGRVRELAQKPRYWQVTATAKTQDPATGEKRRHHFKFMTNERAKLSELSAAINERIHAEDDYLPDCESVMVVARIMVEGGK